MLGVSYPGVFRLSSDQPFTANRDGHFALHNHLKTTVLCDLKIVPLCAERRYQPIKIA